MWRGRLNTPLVTPEELPSGTISRRLFVPANSGFAQLVTGALAELLDPLNYTETPGGLSVNDTVQRMHEMFTEYLNESEPEMTLFVGCIVPHINVQALPSNWLACDGAQYQASEYPELYAALPATLKQATTFNTPDMRLRVPVGLGAAGHAYNVSLGLAGGQAQVTLTGPQMPQHAHVLNSINIPQHTANVPVRQSAAGWSGGAGSIHMHSQTTITGSVQATIPQMFVDPPGMTLEGGNEPHSNVQPFVVTHYAIVAR